MSGGAHLVGHRVDNLSFSGRWVRCDCGVRVTVDETPFPEATQEALSQAFALHRRQAGLLGGIRQAHLNDDVAARAIKMREVK